MMHVDIVHKNARFVGGANYGSHETVDMWFDPLNSEHNSFAATLRKNHAAPMKPFFPQNMPGYRKPRAKRSETPTNLTLTMEKDPSDDEDEMISLSVLSNELCQVKSLPSLSTIPPRFELHDKARGEATTIELTFSNRGFSEADFKYINSSGCFMDSIADTSSLQFKKLVFPLNLL